MRRWFSRSVIKHIIYIIGLIILYVIQTTPGFLAVKEVKPSLVYTGAVAIALFEGEKLGGVYGMLGGLLCDTAGFGVFGYNILFLGFACFIVGVLVDQLMQPTLLSYLVYVGIITLGILSIKFMFTYGIWRLTSLSWLYLFKVIYLTIYTVVISPLIYFFYRFIHRRFTHDDVKFTGN